MRVGHRERGRYSRRAPNVQEPPPLKLQDPGPRSAEDKRTGRRPPPPLTAPAAHQSPCRKSRPLIQKPEPASRHTRPTCHAKLTSTFDPGRVAAGRSKTVARRIGARHVDRARPATCVWSPSKEAIWSSAHPKCRPPPMKLPGPRGRSARSSQNRPAPTCNPAAASVHRRSYNVVP